MTNYFRDWIPTPTLFDNIAKSLTEMLSPLLCMISNLQIKNSGNLHKKINNLNMENESLASLDIKSLYTKYSR